MRLIYWLDEKTRYLIYWIWNRIKRLYKLYWYRCINRSHKKYSKFVKEKSNEIVMKYYKECKRLNYGLEAFENYDFVKKDFK